MEHKYHLWQTGTIRTKQNAGETILKQCNWDYMGSAEYEFGAIPEALGRFLSDKEDKVWGKVEVPITVYSGVNVETTTKIVRYWVRASQEELLLNALKDYRRTVWNLKESPFDMMSKPNSVVFCLDKGYECFFWFKKTFRSQLEETMDKSIELLKLTDRWGEK